MKRSQMEYIAIIITVAIFLLAFLLPAILHAKKEIADNNNKNDIAQLKHAAEDYYNAHNTYPTPSGTQQCSTDFSVTAIGRPYIYCVTHTENGKTTGYYFQTTLNARLPETKAFDEDESRKFDYRILNENSETLYRVCGGEELQCKAS